MVLLVGLLADLVAANRKLLQDAIIRLRRLEYDYVERGARNAEEGTRNGERGMESVEREALSAKSEEGKG